MTAKKITSDGYDFEREDVQPDAPFITSEPTPVSEQAQALADELLDNKAHWYVATALQQLMDERNAAYREINATQAEMNADQARYEEAIATVRKRAEAAEKERDDLQAQLSCEVSVGSDLRERAEEAETGLDGLRRALNTRNDDIVAMRRRAEAAEKERDRFATMFGEERNYSNRMLLRAEAAESARDAAHRRWREALSLLEKGK